VGHEGPEVSVGEPVRAEHELADRCHEGEDAAVTEAQRGDALPVDGLGGGQGVDDGVGFDGVAAGSLGGEKSPVGSKADLGEGAEMFQSFACPEVVGVVDGGLGP
jgi:hypothetical protein